MAEMADDVAKTVTTNGNWHEIMQFVNNVTGSEQNRTTS